MSKNKELAALEEEFCFTPPPFETVSSGNLMIDWVTGTGGLVRGTMVGLAGEPGLGKTTAVLSMMGERTSAGEHVAFIDVEARLSESKGSSMRQLLDILIPNRELFHAYYPKDGTAALKLWHKLIKVKDEKTGKPLIRVIAIDSLSAIVPEEMNEEDYNVNRMGLAAARITFEIKRNAQPVRENGTIVLLIEQVRSNMGANGRPGVVVASNWATQHLTNLRLMLRRGEKIMEGDKQVGQKVVVTATKNSNACPGGSVDVTILFGKGLDRARDVIDAGVTTGIIDKKVGWFTYIDTDDKGVKTEIRAHGENDLVDKLTPIMPRVYKRISEAMGQLNTIKEVPKEEEKSE